MSIYGWIVWGSNNQKIQKKIAYSSSSEIIFSFIITVVFFFIIYLALSQTDSDVIILDSITTSLSLTAMLLLARRKLENWMYWIVADIIYIPLFFYKGLYIASLQYLVFLVLAISGYIKWKKSLRH
jgi:nicotinamide mononucleotide transporter